MTDDTNAEITEENTAPDASPADEEVGGSDANFTTEAGTQEELASSSDGTDSASSDSTTSPSSEQTSPDATGDAGPLGLGATEDNLGAPDASSSDTDSDSAPSTGDTADVSQEPSEEDIKKAHESLRGEHADGEGMTHGGTDTPEKLISNPVNAVTGEPLFPEDNHSDEPLTFASFSDAAEDEDAASKLEHAIELVNQVRDSL